MPNELTCSILAARRALSFAAHCWPHHSEGVTALALDALRVGSGPSRLCVWSRAIETAARVRDHQRRDDLTTLLATLGACVNPRLAFPDAVARPVRWPASDFPQQITDAMLAARRLEAAVRRPRPKRMRRGRPRRAAEPTAKMMTAFNLRSADGDRPPSYALIGEKLGISHTLARRYCLAVEKYLRGDRPRGRAVSFDERYHVARKHDGNRLNPPN